MKFPRPLIKGVFVTRDNRFRATVRMDSRHEAAHVSNSGRLTELLELGRVVLLAEAGDSRRLTDYDLLMVLLPHTLVSIDARLPSRLVGEAIAAGELKEFKGFTVVQRPDAHSLSPHDESDPEFGAALREAVSLGVEASAYSCHVSWKEIVLEKRIPVLLWEGRA